MRGLGETGTTGVEDSHFLERAPFQPMAPDKTRHPTRRSLVFGGFCLCCLPSAIQASETSPLATEEIASGIHIRRGLDEDATLANENAIANTGFIVGRESVLVTDPGGSLTDGERLRASITQTTKLPIKYVVMSHVHPDHIFGASAFLKDAPVFVGHARLKEALLQRGAYYREKLVAVFGADKTGTTVLPTMEIRDTAEIDLGARIIEMSAHAPSHTVCDLSLFDKNTGTLLPADLLFVGRMPSLDGSLRGWIKTLDALKNHAAARAVPGHGPVAVDWPVASAAIMRYLATLERDTKRAIATGIAIDAAIKTVAASERSEWKLFDDYNGRNVGEAYKELEWE
jgi:quinoprotein relay system zinc metallohydrolase 2